jgi:hypothetical protein
VKVAGVRLGAFPFAFGAWPLGLLLVERAFAQEVTTQIRGISNCKNRMMGTTFAGKHKSGTLMDLASR